MTIFNGLIIHDSCMIFQWMCVFRKGCDKEDIQCTMKSRRILATPLFWWGKCHLLELSGCLVNMVLWMVANYLRPIRSKGSTFRVNIVLWMVANYLRSIRSKGSTFREKGNSFMWSLSFLYALSFFVFLRFVKFVWSCISKYHSQSEFRCVFKLLVVTLIQSGIVFHYCDEMVGFHLFVAFALNVLEKYFIPQ